MSLLSYTCQGISSQNRYMFPLIPLFFAVNAHQDGQILFSAYTCVHACAHTPVPHTRGIFWSFTTTLIYYLLCLWLFALYFLPRFFLLLFSFFGLFSKVFSCKSVLLLVVSWSWICPMTWGQQMFTQIKSHSNKAQHDTKGSVTSANMSTFSY